MEALETLESPYHTSAVKLLFSVLDPIVGTYFSLSEHVCPS